MPIQTASKIADAAPEKSAGTPPGLGQRAFGGAIWTLAQIIGSKVAAIAAQLLLAAFLSLDDFGQLAHVILFVSLAALGQQLGVGEILNRRHRKFEKWAEIAFWISLTTGVIGALIVVILSPFADHFFKDGHGMTPLLLVAAIGLPFDAMAVVSQAKLRIDLRFRTLAVLGTSGVFATSILSVAFAATRLIWPHSPVGGAMSLVLPRPIISIATMAVSFLLSGMRLRMQPRFRRWWFVLRDSRYFFFNTFFMTILMMGDYMLASIFFSTERVGAYYFAYNLSTQTLQLVSSSVSGVLLPSFAKLDREPERQKAAYLRVCAIMMLVGTIGCLLQAIMGGPMLHLMYHAKYNEAIPLFQLLTLGMIFLVPSGNGNSLMLAQGRFRRVMAYSGFVAFTFLLNVAIGASTGSTQGIAVGVAICFLMCGPLWVVSPLGFSRATFSEVIRRVYGFPIIWGIVSAMAAWGAYRAMDGTSELPRAFVSAAVAASIYGTAAYIGAETRFSTSPPASNPMPQSSSSPAPRHQSPPYLLSHRPGLIPRIKQIVEITHLQVRHNRFHWHQPRRLDPGKCVIKRSAEPFQRPDVCRR